MTSLKFGTSGLRGLVVDLTPEACQRHTRAFLAHLRATGRLSPGSAVLVGRDLRASSPAIAGHCLAAIAAQGYRAVDAGQVPTPALALAALTRGVPAIMVTGSHIPDDRNGLKFYRADGEIDKDDEAGILAALAQADAPLAAAVTVPVDAEIRAAYVARYATLDLSLDGLTIGVYQHSSVSRDLIVEVIEALGARAVPLGRADTFIPVDTEALRPEDVALARQWAADPGFDALVSTDGDADRPLVADESGTFLRGDVLGLLTAKAVGAKTIVTPVTSTSAIEPSGIAARISRTRVGSPYVLAGMASAAPGVTVGFEANGGVLLGSDALLAGAPLAALPTRDALLPILAVLVEARGRGLALSQLVATLPDRRTASDRIKDSPTENNLAFVAGLAGNLDRAGAFFAGAGSIARLDTTDGLRVHLVSGDIVHYRASGNAPELRCYTEAGTQARADALLAWGLEAARRALA